ncbi:MAG: porin family protein [Proteobacteria bacterium]|nr:porin family protein [Pseudomonadota bacterium]
MRNTLIALAMTAAFAAVPAVSYADNGDAGGAFINGSVGQSNLDKGIYNDNDTGYGVNIGYRWAINPNVALGIEGGYTDLGSFGYSGSSTGVFPNAEIKGWTAGVNGHFNVTPQWYISGRAGLFRADVKGVVGPITTTTGSGSSTITYNPIDATSTKYYAGAGFGYDFSNNFSLGLNYDYYKVNKAGFSANPDLISVSAEYRF